MLNRYRDRLFSGVQEVAAAALPPERVERIKIVVAQARATLLSAGTTLCCRCGEKLAHWGADCLDCEDEVDDDVEGDAEFVVEA